MHKSLGLTVACVVLGLPVSLHAAPIPPVPDSPMRAQLPLGSSFRKRCPDVQIADAGASAVVVFWLPRSGTPSQISIKSSSSSETLDAAAISCVSKLQFPPATTLGDGQPIDSWQQIALIWANQAGGVENRSAPSRSPASGSESLVGAQPRVAPVARPEDAAGQANSVTVRVCVDESGQLKQDPTILRSSGRTALDQAAVKIAAAGAAYYRPESAASKAPASGCAQLAIRFDAK